MGLSVETLHVWKNNIQQAVSGASTDMWEAIGFGQAFVRTNSGKEITFVGHSKGGAEAAAAAIATNSNAIIFNPANLNTWDYNLNAGDYSGNMTQYVVQKEILSEIGLGPVSTNRVPTIQTVSLKKRLPMLAGLTEKAIQIYNHSMNAVKYGLKKI